MAAAGAGLTAELRSRRASSPRPEHLSGAAGWAPVFMVPLHPPFGNDPVHGDAVLRFADISLRQFLPMPARLPSTRLRLHLSNTFGDAVLHIGELRLAWRAARRGAAIQSTTDRRVNFAGQAGAAIPPGQTAVSDPVTLPPRHPGVGHADLAVSLYLPQPTPLASWHLVGSRSSYRSLPGRHVRAGRFPVAATGREIWFLAAVEAAVEAPAPVWVAFGDSITDGAWHQVDADASWPLLWARAWERRAGAWPRVLNAGLSGDRLLGPPNGPGGVERFERDVLEVPDIQGAVVQIGINDLGGSGADTDPGALVDRLIAGLARLAVRARARGLRVVASTLLPVAGSMHDRPGIEPARQAVNRWIRHTVAFDAVVDFDLLLRDPRRPTAIRPDWTSDGLHPSDAGYRVMARGVVDAIDAAGLAHPLR